MKWKLITAFSLLAMIGIVSLPFFLLHEAVADTATSTATSSVAGDLQSQVDAKTQQLNAVLQQLSTTQSNLQGVQQQKTTLQQQMSVIQGNLNVLNLGIQADHLSAQQLTLEIQELQGDLPDIAASIDTKRQSIASLLQEVEKNDSSNGDLLAVFLRNGDLADTAQEAQNILDLQEKLSSDIGNLTSLQSQYEQKINDSQTKQESVAQDQNDLQAKMTIAQDQKAQQQQLLASTKDKESAFQSQLSELQAQQQQIDAQIEALDANLRTKINPHALPTAVAGVLLVPIAGDTKADITQGYGATSFAKNGYKGQWHNGVDLAASIGTPVLAAEDGVVAGVGNNDAYCPHQQYGKYIAINFDNNLTGLYGHLSLQIVKKGDVVKRGQVIGYSGQTGYATGPHLHFTVFAQATFYIGPSYKCGPMPYGGDLDPIPYLF